MLKELSLVVLEVARHFLKLVGPLRKDFARRLVEKAALFVRIGSLGCLKFVSSLVESAERIADVLTCLSRHR